MNIFKKQEGIIGNFDSNSIINSLQALFTLANQIHEKLGKQGYLLDSYLSTFFEAASSLLTYEISTDAFYKSSALRNLCSQIIDRNEIITDCLLYDKAIQVMNDHKKLLNYQEHSTHRSLLYTFLADDFLSISIGQFLPEAKYKIDCNVDFLRLNELYEQITSVIGENLMEQLNLSLKQRFIVTPVMNFYIQSINNDLMYTLITRDIETNKQIFQLYMDTL